MFAVITPALITGAFAERMKFSAFVVFSLIWATIVYDPIAHWVWGVNGWLHNLGALDFAGGTVVHISSGVAALTAAVVMGPRIGYAKEPILPNNLTLTVLGAGLLWFGWFGFNAGSALTRARWPHRPLWSRTWRRQRRPSGGRWRNTCTAVRRVCSARHRGRWRAGGDYSGVGVRRAGLVARDRRDRGGALLQCLQHEGEIWIR